MGAPIGRPRIKIPLLGDREGEEGRGRERDRGRERRRKREEGEQRKVKEN
jgi:hypothetical protein